MKTAVCIDTNLLRALYSQPPGVGRQENKANSVETKTGLDYLVLIFFVFFARLIFLFFFLLFFFWGGVGFLT